MRHFAVLFAVAACGFESRAKSGAIDAHADDGNSIIDAALDAAEGSEMMAAPLCTPSNTALRVCYTFDNTLDDGSSYNNDLASSATSSFVAGRAGGQALATTTGTFTTGATTSLDITTFTFKMWIRPNTLPTAGARMGLLDSSGRYRLFLASDGAIRCRVTNGPDLTSATGVIPNQMWSRVACRFNGSLMTIYVNGSMVATQTMTATVPATGGDMVIGHNSPSGENFNGAIDDVQIFSALVAP
jgi:hypothetical protein